MMNEKNENRFVLNNGVLIPDVAFGTYKAAAGNTSEVILKAIEVGYRCFDYPRHFSDFNHQCSGSH